MHHANDNDNGLRFLSVCSGIEAASVAWGPLGWRAIGFAEIDPAAALVLHRRYNASRPLFMPNPGDEGLKPKDRRARIAAIKAALKMPADGDVTNWGDFTRIDVTKLGRVDILCGGTPCQAFSVAGARMSLADARGNLSLAFVELAHALAKNNGLRNLVWENVLGVLNTPDNAFGCFLAGIVGADTPLPPPRPRKWPNAGMVSGPLGRAAWCVLDAQHFGLAQRRKRIILVADFGNGADPISVLFERLGLPGYSPESREERQGVAPTISARPTGGGGLGTDFDLDGCLQIAQPLLAKGNSSHDATKETYVPEIARCVATREGSSQDYESTTMVAVHAIQAGALRENPNSGPDGVGVQADVAYTIEARAEVQAVCVTGTVTHTLTTEGADASEDGTGRGTPIISVVPIDMRQASRGAKMTNNRSEGQSGGAPGTGISEEGDPSPTIGTSHPPAICFTAKDYGADAEEDLAPTLRAGGHKDGHQNGGVTPAVTVAIRGREGGATAELGGSVATALRASQGGGDKPHALTSAVRRLTPRECERLQGFPDDYTRIPVRRYKAPKITKNRPDDMWEFINGEWWLMAADGPRYKQLGNSWAVPKFRWLGERIQRLMPKRADNDNKPQAAKAAA